MNFLTKCSMVIFIFIFTAHLNADIHELSYLGVGGWNGGEDIEIRSNKVYIAIGSGGLNVVDISNKTKPVKIGGYSAGGHNCMAVGITYNFCYLGDLNNGVYVLNYDDISDIKQQQLDFKISPLSIDISGSYIYALSYQYLQIYRERSKYLGIVKEDDCYVTSGCNTIKVNNGYAYITADNNGLQIVDVTDPNKINIVSSCNVNKAQDIVISGDYAYIATGTNGFSIVNIANKNSPQIIINKNVEGNVIKLDIYGNKLYLLYIWSLELSSGGSATVTSMLVYDIGKVNTPELIDKFDYMVGYPKDIIVQSSYAYVISGMQLYILDVSNVGEISKPVAGFTSDTQFGPYPLEVQFTDSSNGWITEWAWDFGDGDVSSEQNPTHTYLSADTFSVSLIVNGPGGGDTTNTENYIITSISAPIANFHADSLFGEVPFNINFTDESTGEITNRAWDFGDGNTSTEQNPLHTYETSDTFTVSLTVTGPGGTDTETKENYVIVTNPSGVAENGEPLPSYFAMSQNYPNPFNPSTQIEYYVKEGCKVSLVVYNLNGQVARELINAYQQPGKYSLNLNLEGVPSGIYFYRIQMGDFRAVKKMLKIE